MADMPKQQCRSTEGVVAEILHLLTIKKLEQSNNKNDKLCYTQSDKLLIHCIIHYKMTIYSHTARNIIVNSS